MNYSEAECLTYTILTAAIPSLPQREANFEFHLSPLSVKIKILPMFIDNVYGGTTAPHKLKKTAKMIILHYFETVPISSTTVRVFR